MIFKVSASSQPTDQTPRKHNEVIVLPFKVLFLLDTCAEDGDEKSYILMVRAKLSKYLTLSLADSENFHIYLSPTIKNILQIDGSNSFRVCHNSIQFCIPLSA